MEAKPDRWCGKRVARKGRLGTLVEFGCGTGFYTGVLSGKADSIVATDISARMLAVARKQIKASNVRFRLEDCEKTSFPDGAFDTAFMSLVIHFTQPEKALAEMYRALKPGGTLIVTNLDPRRAQQSESHLLLGARCVSRSCPLPSETAERVRATFAHGRAAMRAVA